MIGQGLSGALTRELHEALTNFVGADMRRNRAAASGDKFDKRDDEWMRAATHVVRVAHAAGLIPEGIEWG